MKQLMNPVCPNCGKPLDHAAKYCGFCGSALSFVPNGFPDNDDWKEKTLSSCLFCAMPVPLDRNYCIFCGKKLHVPKVPANQIEEHHKTFSRLHRSEKDRCRRVDCSISFNLEDLSDLDIEKFYLYLSRNRSLSDQSSSEQSHTAKCKFSVSYDESDESLTIDLIARFVQLILKDAAEKFPLLKAVALCEIGRSHLFSDDLGGFIQIDLSNGEVTTDEVPYV